MQIVEIKPDFNSRPNGQKNKNEKKNWIYLMKNMNTHSEVDRVYNILWDTFAENYFLTRAYLK